jgi:hypothetical protein
MNSRKIESTNYLDPTFTAELCKMAKDFDATQAELDNITWAIAEKVNSMWDEHKTLTYAMSAELVFQSKQEFYVACSYQANQGLKHKRFCDSGETMRLWCELVETYSAFEHAERFLDALSLDHLRRAKSTSRRMEKTGKAIPPVVMLAEAVKNQWTAREMQENYLPNDAIPPYDAMKARLLVMTDRRYYPFLKKREDVDYCVIRAGEIEVRIKEAIEAEGKAA